MLNFISELLLVLSTLTPFVILNRILTYKKENSENKNIFYILLLLIYTTTKLFNVDNRNLLFTTIEIIILGLYYKCFYKTGYIKYIISFFVFNTYYGLIKSTTSRFLSFIITGNVVSSEDFLLVSHFDEVKIEISTILFIIFIYIFIYIILKLFDKRLELLNSDKKNYIYLSLALTVNIITIFGIYMSKKLERYPWTYSESYVLGYVVTPKLIWASSIIIILLFIKIIKDNKIKSQKELIQNKLDMQYAHYLSIQESHIKVKKLYHDINNHICCIDNLKNNSKEVNDYINNLKDEIKDFKSIYNTKNMILDIIISEKSEICSKKKIKFICDINFSKVSFMKAIDVSSIFANILDNAIEACDKIHDDNIKKYIRIKGTITKSFFVIKCENSKVNSVKIYKNKLLTDKMNKFMHGIGTQSVKSSLEKYNGEILFEDDKDKFTVNICIPLKQNTDSWVD